MESPRDGRGGNKLGLGGWSRVESPQGGKGRRSGQPRLGRWSEVMELLRMKEEEEIDD